MPAITCKDTKNFSPDQLQELFTSVRWASGRHPEKLSQALKNYGSVFSAWDGDRLVGLIGSIDDGVMTAYVHYLLIHPDYQKNGIGQRLMEKAKEHYRHYLTIVLVSYEKSRSFYERNGFQSGESQYPMYLTVLDD